MRLPVHPGAVGWIPRTGRGYIARAKRRLSAREAKPMTIGIANEHRRASGVLTLGHDLRADQPDEMPRCESRHRFEPVRDERRVPVADVGGREVRGRGPACPWCEIFEQLDAWSRRRAQRGNTQP